MISDKNKSKKRQCWISLSKNGKKTKIYTETKQKYLFSKNRS